MKSIRLIVLASLGVLGIALWREKSPPLPKPAPQTLRTTDPSAGEKQPDPAMPAMPTEAEVRELIAQAETASYHVQATTQGLAAANPRHELSALWSTDGSLKLESSDPRKDWRFSMRCQEAARETNHEAGKLTLHRQNFDEWFINDHEGLEHGFHLPSRPASAGESGFEIAMAINTSLQPELQEEGRAVHFRNHDGEDALFYRGLLVFDAAGRSLPAAMKLQAGEAEGAWNLAIHVDDRDARYPVTIDPVFTTYFYNLHSQPPAEGELFGLSLAMCGNLLAVGIPNADGPNPGETDLGAVDLFRYNPSHRSWTRIERVRPTGFAGPGKFGISVDLEAETLIVGAPAEAAAGAGTGAAYIFRRDQGGFETWGQVARLLPGAINVDAGFGYKVAVSGGMAAISAPRKNSPGSMTADGAIYASFRTPAGSWPAPELLDTYEPDPGDLLGQDLVAEGNRIVTSTIYGETGATPANAGVVVIYEFEIGPDGAPMSHLMSVLTDPNAAATANFGLGLALEGDFLAVGSPARSHSGLANAGTVCIFHHHPDLGWQWQAELRAPDAKADDNFGFALDLSGETLAIGAAGRDSGGVNSSGAAYLFEKAAASFSEWNFVERLESAGKELNSLYGLALAISGDLIAVASPFDDYGPMAHADAGAVQTMVRRSAAWNMVSTPLVYDDTAEALPTDNLIVVATDETRCGHAVAIDRGRAVIGMPGDVSNSGERRGVVQVMAANRNTEDAWGPEDYLESPAAQAGERFGESVAICGEWLLAGAPGYDQGGTADAGRAYLFRYTAAGNWTYFMTLDFPFLSADAEFGAAVALTSRWAFVGAPGMDHGFIFDRHEGGADAWGVVNILDESASGGRFGERVSVDGNFAAFAAPQREGLNTSGKFPVVVPGAGQVQIYQAHSSGGDTVWQEVKTLPQASLDGAFGTPNGNFGLGLTLNGGVLVVGEPGYAGNAGRAKVHAVNQGSTGNWGEVATLASPSPEPGEFFGHSLALGSRWLFAGAPGTQVGGVAKGAAFTWDRFNLTATPHAQVLHPRGQENDEFGFALACSDNDLVVGSPGTPNMEGEPEAGSYAVYRRQSAAWRSTGPPLGSSAGTGDQIGYSVSIDGEFMVTGAPFDQPGGVLAAGSAQLYRRSTVTTSGWNFVKTLQAVDLDVGANFGFSVDVHGDTVVIGAPGWDNRGAAYVFHRNTGGSDNWGQQKRIDLAAISATDDFGQAVAVHGDLIVVGAPNANVGVVDGGSVRVFDRHQGGTNNWGLLDDFNKIPPGPFDLFGSAVDICDGRIVVGALLSDERGDASGAAYLYDRPTGQSEWALQATFAPINSDAGDRVGGAVAVDGEFCVLGGYGDSTHAASSGAVWIYRHNGGANWTNDRKLTVGDYEIPGTMTELRFGAAVAIRGDEIVAGATGYDEGAAVNCGAAHVFTRNQTYMGAWERVAKFSGQTVGITARAGQAVALGSGFVALGAPEADQGGQADAGYLLIFAQDGSAYRDWARARFGDGPVANAGLEATLWGAEADPDKDGLANALEAYMASDPEVAEPRDPDTGVSREGNGALFFRYRVGKETHGAVGRVTWSRDLQDWHGGDVPEGEKVFQTRVYREAADYFIMESSLHTGYLAGEPRLYLRLEVHVP